MPTIHFRVSFGKYQRYGLNVLQRKKKKSGHEIICNYNGEGINF